VNYSTDNSTTDGVGHGTHVAGTIASKNYGVAKKARILSVKVLDDDGGATTATVLKGIEYVVNDAKTRKVRCKKGLVANISLGGTFNKAINDAVKAIVDAGVFVAVAAGNEGEDAEGVSPASEPSVCTVGASMRNDSMVFFSNYGSLVGKSHPLQVPLLLIFPFTNSHSTRRLRARCKHHLTLARERHRYHLWHIHGYSTRRWSGRVSARAGKDGCGRCV